MSLLRTRFTKAYTSIAAVVLVVPGLAWSVPVIPGAKGFGIETPAGRGGQVFLVTNLSNSGTGSLRKCVDASGPRVCVFEISGTIVLTSNLEINNPFITIAGQTAPSPGIAVRGGGLKIRSHDVLVQHLRFRVGDDPEGPSPGKRDTISINSDFDEAHNIVLDHLSASWGVDENLEIWSGFDNITVRHSIIAEGLRDSIHPEGSHGYGVLVGPGPGKISFLNSVLAHNTDRNIAGRGDNAIVFANNIVYNWVNFAYKVATKDGGGMTLLENAYFKGPNSVHNSPVTIRSDVGSGFRLYIDKTLSDNCPEAACDPWSVVKNETGYNLRATTMPVTIPGYSPADISDDQVYQSILDDAGARPKDRDSADIRVINEVRNRTGSIINSPSDVGGWPDLQVNQRTLSIPGNPHSDDDSDGYTNLEEWLHSYSDQLEFGLAGSPRPNPPTLNAISP